MSGRFVRSSKFRHVFGKAFKREDCYDDVKVGRSAWDSNKIAVNREFIAVCWEAGGGGSAAVIPQSQTGKLAPSFPLVAGHTAAVLDVAFSPFNDNLLATSSDDAYAKIWQIPDGGLTETMTDPAQVLKGHRRKVGAVLFNPVANNVLATTSTDYTIKVWDIEAGEAKLSVDGFSNIIQSVDWNYDGSLMIATSKDKKMRLVDPRNSSIVSTVQAHDGVKGSRVVWMGDEGKVITVGFSRSSERQFFIWDVKNLDKPLAKQNMDTSSGIIMPFYDFDTHILYLAGKGDGNIRYYELVDDDKQFYFVSEYKSASPQRGMASLPKTACDIAKCEVNRMYKVGNTNIEPISFTVPRKSDLFQDDIFPDTIGQEPSLDSGAWFGGSNAQPKTVNLENAYVPPPKPKQEFTAAKVEEVKGPKDEKELRAEYEKLLNRVAYLESELKKKDAIISDLKA